MKYISVDELAIKLNKSKRRVQQMCLLGEIKGAIKIKNKWVIPLNFLKQPTNYKPLPIGISDYKAATSDYYYVDKTMMIKDIIDKKAKVSLFTRPRRFGKTLNMDMLRVFFEKTDEDNSRYFKDKYIWKMGEEYTNHQGQYPVIYLSFKDVKFDNWKDTYEMITKLITREFNRHVELYSSRKLNEFEKE